MFDRLRHASLIVSAALLSTTVAAQPAPMEDEETPQPPATEAPAAEATEAEVEAEPTEAGAEAAAETTGPDLSAQLSTGAETEPAETEPAAAVAPATRADELGWDQKHPADKFYFHPGKGLTVESEDGLFKLQTRVRGQFLYQMEKPDGGDASQAFMLRRARVVFSGNWWGEDNTFKMELAVSPRDVGMTADLVDLDGDGSPDETVEDDNPITGKTQHLSRSPLLDLYVQFKQLRDLNVRVGQYKIPFSRQRVISSGNLMFVDRSIVNAEFTLDRDLGFDLRSSDLFGLGGKLRYYAGLYTGEGHSSFQERKITGADHGFGLNALLRVEVLPFGNFKDYHESDLQRTDGPGLSLGATIAHVGNARGSRGVLGSEYDDNGTTDFLVGEADAMFKYRGLSVQTEFMIRDGERNLDGLAGVTPEPSKDGWGLTGQIGYLTPVNVEVAARHSAVRFTAASGASDKNETGIALGYYVAGHPYKIQADYIRLYGESIDDGEHMFRTQLQLSL